MTALTLKDQVEIIMQIIAENKALGCKCPQPSVEDVEGEGSRAYLVTEHHSDCPVVAHYSKPENQPR